MTELLQQSVAPRGWPCAEIHKTPQQFELEVETPGFGPEDLEVEVEGHKLVVLGTPEHGHEGAAFSFVFELPADIDPERLRATFRDYVLTVTAPRRVGRNRKLEIELDTRIT